MAPDPKEVARAQKLLQMRGTGDVYRKVAVEKKIKALPPHLHAAAKPQGAGVDNPAPLHDLAAKVGFAYDEAFKNQEIGLHSLESTLEHIKPPTNIVAQLALTAVTIGISAVLTPAAGMAVEGIEGALAEVLKTGMEKTIDAAVDGATESIAKYHEEQDAESEAEAIRNFIEWQSLAISAAQHKAKDHVVDLTTQLTNAGDLAQGLKALTSLHDSVNRQAEKATQIQILHSAATWAGAKAAEDGGDSPEVDLLPHASDVDNEEVKTGDLEVWATVDHSAKLTVSKANWAHISRSLEKLVKEQGSIPIQELGVRMRIYLHVQDPQNRSSNAQFEYTPAPTETGGAMAVPVIVVPDDPAEQRAICSAVIGFEQVSDDGLLMSATAAASELGNTIAARPVSSLKFGS